jgi:membrane-associated protease RseP (regulator of RpoE activity)
VHWCPVSREEAKKPDCQAEKKKDEHYRADDHYPFRPLHISISNAIFLICAAQMVSMGIFSFAKFWCTLLVNPGKALRDEGEPDNLANCAFYWFLAAFSTLIAVFIILMLLGVIPSIFSFAPGGGLDRKITQSVSYWKNARPIAIIDYTIYATSCTGKLVLQNFNSDQITITNITFADPSGRNETSVNSTSFSLGPGEMKTVAIANACKYPGAIPGMMCEARVTFNYLSSNGVAMNQTGGAKTLIGRYQ